jgi:hypothetical protein
MRPSHRILPLLRVLFFLGSFFCAATRVATLPDSVLADGLQQTDASVAAETQAQTPTRNLPSVEWADKLRELVDKVATVYPPPARIELMASNMSSLSVDEVAAIDERLKLNLSNRRFRIVAAEPVDADLNVTFSEGVEGYVIVAKIRRDTAEQVLLLTVSKGVPSAKRNGGVALDENLIWEQAGKILDFALPPSAGKDPTMIVLEAGRIMFYIRKDSQWQLGQSITIPSLRPWLRALRGHIDLSHGIGAGIARIPGIDCKGDFGSPDTIQCGFVDQGTQLWNGADASPSKISDLGGDSVNLSLECEGRRVVLATGKGDWTETDVIQAYEISPVNGQGALASGKPAAFDGPVTSLWWAGTGGVANAVVQNLKTGNYEAYIVTATCSH